MKDTAALNHVRYSIYLRLILGYYAQETHYPDDLDEIYDQAAARTPAERQAADYVLRKFFRHVPGSGYLHERCDQEIHRFHQKRPAAEERRRSLRERQERHRDRRSRLFEELRARGISMPWDASMAALEEAATMVRRAPGRGRLPGSAGTDASAAPPQTPPVTRDRCVTGALDNGDLTATSPQSPFPSISLAERASFVEPRAVEDARADEQTSKAEEAAMAMADAGLPGVNASDPVLLAMLTAGYTVGELKAAAADAATRGKGPGWALKRAQGKRADAAAVRPQETAVPSECKPPGWRDPALVKIESDAAQAAPVPESVRQLRDKLRHQATAE